jgi:hypothetical protein
MRQIRHVQGRAREISAAQICANELRVYQLCALHRDAGEVGATEICTAAIRIAEVAERQVNAREIGAPQHRIEKAARLQPCLTQVTIDQA